MTQPKQCPVCRNLLTALDNVDDTAQAQRTILARRPWDADARRILDKVNDQRILYRRAMTQHLDECVYGPRI